MKTNIFIILILLSSVAGCSDWSIDYYEEGYSDGYNDAILGGQSRYSPPTHDSDNIAEYNNGYSKGYNDGLEELGIDFVIPPM